MAPKEGDRVRPFSCGSQYADWVAANCEECAKASEWYRDGKPAFTCDLEAALSHASIGDGTVDADTARRIALPVREVGRPGPYCWRCGEWQDRDEPPDVTDAPGQGLLFP